MLKTLGRPPVAPDQRLDSYVGFALSREMRQRLQRQAGATGCRSVAEYIRRRLDDDNGTQETAQAAD